MRVINEIAPIEVEGKSGVKDELVLEVVQGGTESRVIVQEEKGTPTSANPAPKVFGRRQN